MRNILDYLFVRTKHVCPWYICFTFDNAFRKFVQNPNTILRNLVRPEYRVLDIGPGQGYFSIPMAKMVGDGGQVVSIDIQEKMLSILKRRADKAHVGSRIVCRLVKDADFGLSKEIDFALAFWMVHEVPDKRDLIYSIFKALKPGGKFLLSEPLLHVTKRSFEDVRKVAETIGFESVDRPKIFFSRSIIFRKV